MPALEIMVYSECIFIYLFCGDVKLIQIKNDTGKATIFPHVDIEAIKVFIYMYMYTNMAVLYTVDSRYLDLAYLE